MKLSKAAFPYPVLRANSSDFGPATKFEVEVAPVQIDEGDGTIVRITVDWKLTNDYLANLVEKETLSISFEVSCSLAHFRESVKASGAASNGMFVYDFPAGDLYGKVEVQPMIVCTNPITGYCPPDAHEEFSTIKFDLNQGDIIAFSPGTSFYVEYDNLQVENFVTVKRKDDGLDDGLYEVAIGDVTSDITIWMADDLYDWWEAVRNQRAEYQPFLMASIYKDCLVTILEYLVANCDNYRIDEIRWVRAFKSKLADLGISAPDSESDFNAINKKAQQMISNAGLMKVEVDADGKN